MSTKMSWVPSDGTSYLVAMANASRANVHLDIPVGMTEDVATAHINEVRGLLDPELRLYVDRDTGILQAL